MSIFDEQESEVEQAGRTIAIGDIHGCDVALIALLENLQPTQSDTLIVLGDVVDRGPNSRRVIDILIDVSETTQFEFVLGNHEEMMLDSVRDGNMIRGWLRHGGLETLESYGGDISKIPPWHIDFLDTTDDYVETSDAIFVHANLESGVPLAEQSTELLRWSRISGMEEPWPDGRQVICGHTPQMNGLPKVTEGRICIDTYAYGSGSLTALVIESGEIHQAKQSGEYRAGVTIHELM